MAQPAVATVLGGWWNNQGVGSLASISGANDDRRGYQQRMGGRGGNGLVSRRAMWNSLIGQAFGGSVQVLKMAIEPSTELGGVRRVSNNLIFNRLSTNADVLEMQDWFRRMSVLTNNPNPPINLDRNPLGTR